MDTTAAYVDRAGVTVVVESPARATLRRVGRAVMAAAMLTLLVYCLGAAWGTLQQLRDVSLFDVRRALHVVSVRDAILCVVGYRLFVEVLRAVVDPRRR